MKKLSLSGKLFVSFAILLALKAIITGGAYYSIMQQVDRASRLYYESALPFDPIVRFSISYGNARSALRDLGHAILTAGDDQHYIRIAEDGLDAAIRHMREYQEMLASDNREEYDAVASIYNAIVEYADISLNRLLPAMGFGGERSVPYSFYILHDILAPIDAVIHTNLYLLTTLNANRGSEIMDEAIAGQFHSTVIGFSVVGLIILAAILLGVYLSRLIAGSLKVSAASLQDIGEKLGAAVNQVNDSAAVIAESSNEQAASVEQTSATMSQTSAMIASNTENTGTAAKIALETEQSTTSSEQSMAELLEAMAELKESSNTVGKIVKTIDDIAFQTNLLAINATVEAARAGGDAGRSFGVVAEEVRNLALKSAQSAADTAEMIQKNIALTNTSRASAEKVLQMSKDDAENARKLSKLIAEIAAASEEQANGAHQISAAMSLIEKSTQSNAATSQQSAASAAMLKELMVELESIYYSVNAVVYGKR